MIVFVLFLKDICVLVAQTEEEFYQFRTERSVTHLGLKSVDNARNETIWTRKCQFGKKQVERARVLMEVHFLLYPVSHIFISVAIFYFLLFLLTLCTLLFDTIERMERIKVMTLSLLTVYGTNQWYASQLKVSCYDFPMTSFLCRYLLQLFWSDDVVSRLALLIIMYVNKSKVMS